MFGPKFWIAVAPTVGLAVDVVAHLDDTTRGAGSFGSTGVA